MNFFRNKIKVVTHDGSFHADEVFACATLSLWAQKMGHKLEIVRSRDAGVVAKADIVVDVGMEYDLKRGRFDHHQKEGAGTHKNGIPFASFGLIWKHYGMVVCGNEEVFKTIEQKLVSPIDASDNGINISIPNQLGITDHKTGNVVHNLNPTWEEGYDKINLCFKKALVLAMEILIREMVRAKAESLGSKLTKDAIRDQNEPDILILNKKIDWYKTVSGFKNIKFVVYPNQDNKTWSVQVGRDDIEDYNSDRAKLPKDWGGLRDKELEKISGVKSAIFCANGGWFGVAGTKEGAIEMAKIALQNSKN